MSLLDRREMVHSMENGEVASHTVLRDTVNKIGTKMVAEELKLSTAMIYKWCQPSNGDLASGERNPLDRILSLCEAANSDKPVKWLCERRNESSTAGAMNPLIL